MYEIPHRPERNWIDKLPEHVKNALRDEMCYIDLVDGQTLYSMGDKPRGIYEIVEGRFKLSALSESGKETTLSIYEAPTTISDTVISAGDLHMHNAIALGSARVGLLKTEGLDQLRGQYPEINSELLKVTSRRLLWFMKYLENSAVLKLEARVASRLHSFAIVTGEKIAGQEDAYLLEIKQDDLANMIGVTRQSVNKVLKDWEAIGLLEITYRKMRINNISALLDIVVGSEADSG